MSRTDCFTWILITWYWHVHAVQDISLFTKIKSGVVNICTERSVTIRIDRITRETRNYDLYLVISFSIVVTQWSWWLRIRHISYTMVSWWDALTHICGCEVWLTHVRSACPPSINFSFVNYFLIVCYATLFSNFSWPRNYEEFFYMKT